MAEPIKILNSLGEELVSFEPTDIFYEVVGTYAVAACGLMFYRPSTVEILKALQRWSLARKGISASMSGISSATCEGERKPVTIQFTTPLLPAPSQYKRLSP